MKIQWKKLAICVAIPLAVGALSALLTRSAMRDFAALDQPPLSPPGWLFPVVWSILYALMGIASYLVVVTESSERSRNALTLYGVQLAFNFVWSILFFNMGAYLLALVWLAILWVLILCTLLAFRRIHLWAGRLIVPYLLWVSFAAYLNAGIWYLN